MGLSYLYYPSFGRGRRNNYAGAIAGYIYAAHLNGAALDAPIRLSPKKLSILYHTDPETIRTAIRRLCAGSVRLKPLLEYTGRSEYRLTPLGFQLIENDTPQYFKVADLLLPDFTPKLAAVKNTKAEHPAAAAKWWGMSLKQWYKLNKQVRKLQNADSRMTKSGYRGESKTDTGVSQKRVQRRPKAGTGETHPQYRACSDIDRSRRFTRTREERPISIPKETEHGPDCVCEKCFLSNNTRSLEFVLGPQKKVKENHLHLQYRA